MSLTSGADIHDYLMSCGGSVQVLKQRADMLASRLSLYGQVTPTICRDAFLERFNATIQAIEGKPGSALLGCYTEFEPNLSFDSPKQAVDYVCAITTDFRTRMKYMAELADFNREIGEEEFARELLDFITYKNMTSKASHNKTLTVMDGDNDSMEIHNSAGFLVTEIIRTTVRNRCDHDAHRATLLSDDEWGALCMAIEKGVDTYYAEFSGTKVVTTTDNTAGQ